MELKAFVKDTILQLNEALIELKTETKHTYIFGGEKGNNINFDLSVTIENETGSKTGGKINVLSLGFNGESDSNNKINNMHRIKFSICEYSSNRIDHDNSSSYTPDYGF